MSSKEKEEDPYKYFQNRLKGTAGAAVASPSDSDEEISATSINNMPVASDKFEDDYSMDQDDDFSLSVSLKKPDAKKPAAPISTLKKMSAEEKAEIARKKAEEEFKRIQA